MNSFLIGTIATGILLANTAGVISNVSQVPKQWELITPTSISLVCSGVQHKVTLDTISQNITSGVFSGKGVNDSDNSYTWDISGNVSEDNLTFRLVYTGKNAGYTLNGVGKIASNGSVSGTTDGKCESFSMEAGSAIRFTQNQGNNQSTNDYARESIQSRDNTPVQSDANGF